MQDNRAETTISWPAEAPVSEVRAKRRQFTVAQKLAILRVSTAVPADRLVGCCDDMACTHRS